MSVWSGIIAAGVAIALVSVVISSQPLWEWRLDTPQDREIWSYGVFSAHHSIYNLTTQNTTLSRDYAYDRLASLQPHMASAFAEFGQFIVFGLLAAIAGVVLSVLTVWKKLRGIFAGVAFLAACALTLYAAFVIVFTIPTAAGKDLYNLGRGIPQFMGQTVDPNTNTYLTWTPLLGWALAIGAGLAFAWASSDIWHIQSAKKATGAVVYSAQLVPKPVPALPPPPLPVAPVIDVPAEPVIEEVFLIGSNGLLIKHMSRSLMSDKDRDVVGSMISAISSFVREAFSERNGEVHEVSLGDHRFVMCNDGGLVLAVLVTAGQTEDIVHRLRHLLAILKDRYGERFARWQGEPVEGIEDELGVLWDPYHLPPPPVS